jgi:hypothetical protein
MGTISDKLMRIINTKEDIRRALISKGYDVPTSIPFKEYAKMILDLPCNADSFPDIEGIVARYSALGLTNEQMAENPVWKDLTGNGHDLQMKNFAWKGMSGVSGYGDENYQTFYKFTLDDYFFIATPPGVKHMNFTFRVTGLQPGNKLTLAFFGTTNTVYGTWNKDGIYTVDADIVEAGKPTYFYNGYGATRGEFTIEILPLYPGALVFDGVDDYGVCDNFPIMTKEKGYTVVALRQWITRGEIAQGLVSNVKNWLKDGAFLLEYRNIQAEHLNKPISFGAIGSEMDLSHILTYQTSKSCNGVSITTGNFEGTDVLHVGKLAPTKVGTCINAAIWELVFLDHDATEEELTKIKDYFVKTYPWLFPYQAWTVVGKTNEDKDRATIANITGNGNNLVLSNFGFAEGSGYGLYNMQKFTNWNHVADRGDIVKNGYSVTITNSKITGSSTNYNTDILYSYNSSSTTTIIFKVTGLVDGQKIFLGRKSATDAYVIDKDGIYRSDYNIPQKGGKVIVGIGTVGFTGECNITIEQIPEYEGYLVTDGVDDKIVSSSFGMGKDFTVVGEWTILQNINVSSLRKQSSFIIRNNDSGLSLFINRISHAALIHTKSLRAFCSNGVLYKSDWTEQIDTTPQDITSSDSELLIASHYDNKSEYDKIAFKNLAIYPTVLSKDECIKAYNYLQTLKSK